MSALEHQASSSSSHYRRLSFGFFMYSRDIKLHVII